MARYTIDDTPDLRGSYGLKSSASMPNVSGAQTFSNLSVSWTAQDNYQSRTFSGTTLSWGYTGSFYRETLSGNNNSNPNIWVSGTYTGYSTVLTINSNPSSSTDFEKLRAVLKVLANTYPTFPEKPDLTPKVLVVNGQNVSRINGLKPRTFNGTNIFPALSRLPEAFQEVEFLQSTGTQYIDIGYKLTNFSKSIIVIKLNDNVSNGSYGMFGARADSDTNNFTERVFKDTNDLQIILDFNNSSYSQYRLTANNLNNSDLYKTIVDKNERSIYENNVFLATNNTICSDTFTSLLNAYLFACNGTNWNNAQAKLYSCQIYDNNVLVRDFVPCYRKADQVAGLYDLVNGVFYTNAGTGTFIVGGNV